MLIYQSRPTFLYDPWAAYPKFLRVHSTRALFAKCSKNKPEVSAEGLRPRHIETAVHDEDLFGPGCLPVAGFPGIPDPNPISEQGTAEGCDAQTPDTGFGGCQGANPQHHTTGPNPPHRLPRNSASI